MIININIDLYLFKTYFLEPFHIYRSGKSDFKSKITAVNVNVIQINEKEKSAINYIHINIHYSAGQTTFEN